MNWISFAITAVLLVVVVLEYRLKHINTDKRTNAHKALRKTLLWLTISLLVAQQAVSVAKESRRDEREAKKDERAEETRQKQEKEIRALQNVLATNTLLSPEFRSKVLELTPYEVVDSDTVDLKLWRAEKKKRVSLAQLQEEIRIQTEREQLTPVWASAVPVYEYTIQKLTGMLSQIAKQRDQKLISTFRGIPRESTITGSKPLGYFKIGTNTNWDIEIISFPKPYISFRHGSIHLNLEAYVDSVTHNYGCTSARSGFQACVDSGLREFLIEISEADEKSRSQ